MAPTLLSSDMVLVGHDKTRSEPAGDFRPERRNGSLPPSCHAPRLRMLSENSVYSRYERLFAMVNIVGLVRWFARKI